MRRIRDKAHANDLGLFFRAVDADSVGFAIEWILADGSTSNELNSKSFPSPDLVVGAIAGHHVIIGQEPISALDLPIQRALGYNGFGGKSTCRIDPMELYPERRAGRSMGGGFKTSAEFELSAANRPWIKTAPIDRCPYCTDKGPHENNGVAGRGLIYRCKTCRGQFGPGW